MAVGVTHFPSISAVRTATIVLAASDSPHANQADYTCTGTDDQDTMMAIIALLPSQGGIIKLLSGRYSISDEVNVQRDNVFMLGEGWGTVLYVADGSNCTVVHVGTGAIRVDGFKLAHLKVDGNAANQGTYAQGGVWLHGTALVTTYSALVDDVWIYDFFGTGLFLDIGHYDVVRNCVIEGCHRHGIYGCSTTQALITGNTIKNNAQTNPLDSGIYLHSALRVKIEGNSIVDDQSVPTQNYGIDINHSSDTNHLIVGNVIRGNVSGPITDVGKGTVMKGNSGIRDRGSEYLQNTSGRALALGDVVVLKAVASGQEVDTTTAQGDDKVYGMVEETIANGDFGYIQTIGETAHLKVNGTVNIGVGDLLGTYTDAGIARQAAAGDMAFAIAREAYTGADSNGVIDAELITPRKL